jgi:uncharacterized protein
MALKPETLLVDRLKVTQSQIIQFCQRWHITEFALFGSILRDDFQPDTSDVDVLVVFSSEARKGLSEWITMQDELTALFGHQVDLVNKAAIQENHNWIRRRNILETAQVIYGS